MTKDGSGFSAHYISGTHWDREWYRPFQEYRVLLVEVVDSLLDLMESNGDFKYFHFDGQTCMLDDYVSVRPENRDRLSELIVSGRILIGPWYTMPDLFGPGEEALVRNLLVGRRVARAWGVEPMKVAYTCDMFGHPSQMAQIYRGFDMGHCVLGRGTNEHTTPAFFTWSAPDGSTVFTFKLQDRFGYGAFFSARANKDKHETICDSVTELVRHEMKRTNGRSLCLMDAQDHAMPAADVGKYLSMLLEACPGLSVLHSTLPAFFAEAESTAHDLPVRVGELREPSKTTGSPYLYLIPNCSSARVKMKLANDAAQDMLGLWAEPWLTVANIEGAGLAEGLLAEAWDKLLLCHAHDSICGCSIDQVHRDVINRLEGVEVLSRQLRHKSFAGLTAGCADLAKEDHEFTVTVANGAPWTRKEVVTFDVDLPCDYPTSFCDGFTGQRIKSFRLYDMEGREVAYQRLAYEPGRIERTHVAVPATCNEGKFDRYTVAAELELPAMGFTSLLVKGSRTPVRRMGSLRTAPSGAANEYLAIEVAGNGTLTIEDKASGEVYRDLLIFEDSEETGDGWFHVRSVNGEAVLSTSAGAQVSVVHDGPDLVTFRVEVVLRIPRAHDWHGQRRSDERTDLRIVSLVTLRRGSRMVEVVTEVDNRAEDHQLRMLLPTDVAAEDYVAHHPFDFVSRQIALDGDTADWQEAELSEKPFLDMQAVGDGSRGLAFLSAGGMHEGGVADDERRTMQVTLMRCFRYTVGTAGEPEGQEPGKRVFRYGLMPFSGQLEPVGALRAVQAMKTGVMTRQTGASKSGYPAMGGERAPRRSFVELADGNLVLSAVKPREAGGEMVLRLWNPTAEPRRERVKFWRDVAGARYLKLSEDGADDAQAVLVADSEIVVAAPPRKIVTVEVTFGGS